MIFDVNDQPLTDDEYQQRLLTMAILLVKGAGGQIVIPQSMKEELREKQGKTYLQQHVDPMNGNTVLTVGERP